MRAAGGVVGVGDAGRGQDTRQQVEACCSEAARIGAAVSVGDAGARGGQGGVGACAG